MKVLVVGSGGREHALVWALRKSREPALELFCAPGNAGIAELASCIAINASNVSSLAEFAERKAIDLTMVGPEASLAAGIVDEFQHRGLRIVGPTMQAARLESSKAFAKDFMQRHSIPTARYRVANSQNEAIEILHSGEFGDENSPVVIKADGLAAGKGVVVAKSRTQAIQSVYELMNLGEPAERIIIEEALCGREVSVLLFSDGEDFRLMPPARDHKRIGEGDTGPNTGGMGAITDKSILDDATLETVVERIVKPTLRGARFEGFPFRGILFVGLMLTSDGPQVLEYNVRFGDPETQAILVRLETDLVEVLEAISNQKLASLELNWSPNSSACVVLAARGYPGKSETGAVIHGLDVAGQCDDATIFHAATSRGAGGELIATGGRVLGVTATGAHLEAALSRCYATIAEIHWEGMQYRRDIGRISGSAAVSV